MSTTAAAWDEVLPGRKRSPTSARSPPARRAPRPPRPDSTRASRRRSSGSGSTRSSPISARHGTRPPPAATSSSPPAPPPARRWPSTCRCSTRSRATRSSARSTSTRPRRSHRIRRAGWPSSRLPLHPAGRSTTARPDPRGPPGRDRLRPVLRDAASPPARAPLPRLGGRRLPETERAARETLAIPMWAGIDEATQERVVSVVREAVSVEAAR